MQSNGVADNGGGSLQGGIPATGILGMQGMAPMAPMGGPPIMPNPEGAQQFCLRWNSYPATVATQLAALRAAEDFVDVTLACDGRQLRAHKLVLSACSPYFMQLFKSTPCQHPVIFLRDVGFRQLVALLEFMYAGEVNVSQVELPALLRTAEALQVRGLADTTPNNNNNNNPCTAPPKPAYSPTYGQQVGTPVMTSVPSVPIPTEQPICPEVPSNPQPGPAQKSSRREERSSAGNKQRDGGEEENSNDSMESHEDFEVADAEMKPFGNDENAPEQVDETSNTFQNETDDQEAGRVTTNQSGIGNASTAGSQSEEETSEEEEDDDDGDCKDFPYQSDASYGQDNIPEGSNSANGENPGPSGGSAADGDGDGSNPLVPCKGEGNGAAGNGGNSRNRLSRSLWPPGIPYHGPQQCPYCPRVLSNVGNWRKHVLTMHFAREKNYKCRHCASSFRTAEYLQKHYVRVHNYPQKMTRRKYVEQT